jgi:hypothetical protein
VLLVCLVDSLIHSPHSSFGRFLNGRGVKRCASYSGMLCDCVTLGGVTGLYSWPFLAACCVCVESTCH